MGCRVDSDTALSLVKDTLRHDLSKHMHKSFISVVSTDCNQLFTSRHAPRVLSIDQNLLSSFFLIPEFLLWASCLCPNHCCLTLVTHGEQKQKIHSSLPPSHSDSSCPWTESLTSTPAGSPRPWQWHCYHPAFLTLAQHAPQRYLFRQYMFPARNVSGSSGKENKLSWTWT